MSGPQPTSFRPSAPDIAWGLVLLVVGGAIAQIAQYQSLRAALDPYDQGSSGGLMWVGAITALVGLVLTVNGVYHLASSVDRLARDADRQA